MIEYKGYFSTVNRLASGEYIGVVTGLRTAGVEIQAASICSLRQKFEAVVDDWLLTARFVPLATVGLNEIDSRCE